MSFAYLGYVTQKLDNTNKSGLRLLGHLSDINDVTVLKWLWVSVGDE
jgi:hypothetical protein